MKKTIFLFLLLAWPILLSAQQLVKGVVVDETGLPMPGVTVVVTGTTLGTVTGNDGRYSIEVPPGSYSLTFSFLGMKPQEVNIDARNNIDIVLSFETIGVEEVVVTVSGNKT